MSGNHAHHAHHRFHKTLWLTFVSALVNLGLSVMKIWVGWLSHSHALVADGLHSFSDLITDGLVFFAARIGHKDADCDHPYGHERFETAGTLFVSLLLVLTGLGIFLDLAEHLRAPDMPTVHSMAFIAILVSFFVNEILFQVTHRTAKSINSDLLLANAWHHRSDALSSLVVLLGTIGSYYGYPKSDVIAAVFVALLIIKMGVDLSWSSVKELVDTAAPPGMQQKIKETIVSVAGVEALHEFRTRQMGNKILVDVHLLVAPYLTVSEGHYIGDQVQKFVREEVDAVADIVVHIDPEDDEKSKPSSDLPGREDILLILNSVAESKLPGFAIQNTYIHYLDGNLEVDLVCSCQTRALPTELDKLEQAVKNELSHSLPELGRFRLLVAAS